MKINSQHKFHQSSQEIYERFESGSLDVENKTTHLRFSSLPSLSDSSTEVPLQHTQNIFHILNEKNVIGPDHSKEIKHNLFFILGISRNKSQIVIGI